MPLPTILLVIVAGVVLTITSIIVLIWLSVRLWCRPKRRLTSKGPEDYGLRYEPIAFQSHNFTIRGWFIPSLSGPQPASTIILVHGWSGNAADMLPAACFLHQAKFSVVLYDARGHGVSNNDGPITLLKVAQDILACLDYLATRADVDMRRVGVLGHSFGG
ncbi:MAG: alpha/beta fold hydrolase [Gammaproteobacteria bacterium]|nr:alpha/beta fold hydrolase [Gammaproteobacteria bacterium]